MVGLGADVVMMMMRDEEGDALGLESQEAEQPARRSRGLQCRAHCENQGRYLLARGEYWLVRTDPSPSSFNAQHVAVTGRYYARLDVELDGLGDFPVLRHKQKKLELNFSTAPPPPEGSHKLYSGLLQSDRDCAVSSDLQPQQTKHNLRLDNSNYWFLGWTGILYCELGYIGS